MNRPDASGLRLGLVASIRVLGYPDRGNAWNATEGVRYRPVSGFGMTRRNYRRYHSKHLRFRRRTPPGTAPGSLTSIPGSPPSAIRVMAYGEHEFLEREVQSVDEIRELRNRYSVIWVDVEGLGDAAIVAKLGDLFGLHPLALEDVLNTHQRAKVDEF